MTALKLTLRACKLLKTGIACIQATQNRDCVHSSYSKQGLRAFKLLKTVIACIQASQNSDCVHSSFPKQ